MGSRDDGGGDHHMWKVNVIGANVTIKEAQNPNDTVIFINGDHESSDGYVSDSGLL